MTDDAFAAENALIDGAIDWAFRDRGRRLPRSSDLPLWQSLRNQPAAAKLRFLNALLPRAAACFEEGRALESRLLNGLIALLVEHGPPLDARQTESLVLAFATTEFGDEAYPAIATLLTRAENDGAATRDSALRKAWQALRQHCNDNVRIDEFRARITALVDGPDARIESGEAWADAAIADIAALDADAKAAWAALLDHVARAKAGKPTPKWSATATTLRGAAPGFRECVLRWFSLVPADESRQMLDRNANVLKGLAWCCADLPEDRDVARALGALALTSFKKLPGIGARAVRVGNAAILALGRQGLSGVAQLSVLAVRVKVGTARNSIEKALTAAADAAGLSRDDLEEIGVPEYGFAAVGRLERTLGEHVAVVTVTGNASTDLAWRTAAGKLQKTVPAAVKRDHAAALKSLRADVKDIQKLVTAQAHRIEATLLTRRRWPVATWRERYVDHPLVGTITRRLIWRFRGDDREAIGAWHDGRIVDRDGIPIDWPEAEVELWHPMDDDADEVAAWRAWLVEHRVRQPFKQAHREVYLLTDAERTTRVYSNRFASHILKQHQFKALCDARGWHYALRGAWDSPDSTATLAIPSAGLHAEFWTDPTNDDYETDVSESGIYLYVATDQVRFYRDADPDAAPDTHWHRGERGAEPVPIADVPPRVLTEVLRDVDLFVGVASVGNDPAWEDGGPEGRYRDYWTSYSFGELSATAETRRTVLEGLVPALKIADRCTLTERFLVVRGDRRTYKIHLGSANILMEPNDQYLCIVPGRGAAAGTAASKRVFLPFEGDATLATILSKAFLLAADTKITDRTILSQIG